MILTVSRPSVLKLEEKQSVDLPDNKKFDLEPGRKLAIVDHDMRPSGHVWVKFDKWTGPTEGYLWKDDIEGLEIHGNILGNEPKYEIPNPPRTVGIGRTINIPGIGDVFVNSPIIRGGNFSWAEATKGGTRIPTNPTVGLNIVSTAKIMEEIRKRFDDRPITINSWYRDPVTNKRVGGASSSRHLNGDAVDFVVQGISPMYVNESLKLWWGKRGGLASASVFTHIDARGYLARWEYGF